MDIVISLLLAGIVLLSISLQRAYGSMPVKELKLRARHHDETAIMLHKAATYGVSLRAMLWFLVGLSAAGFFVFTIRHTSTLTSLLLSCILVWLGFAWLTNKDVKRVSFWFASTLAPVFAWLLQYLHTPIMKIAEQLRRFNSRSTHTGIYDKEDLLELINNQNSQPDNRIEQHELELAFNALTFGDKLISDYLTPRRVVKNISVEESIGPLLMSELHKSGFSRFPVYDGKKDNFVGTLFLRDLVNTKSTAKVKSVMRSEITFVHEDQNLYEALQAILKTRNHLLIVVNTFEEYVGVITIEDVLGQVIGQTILDEFDEYDSLRAVAKREAAKEHSQHQDLAEEPEQTAASTPDSEAADAEN